jgi:predicted dehydrogenase
MALNMADAGVHTLIEKPLADSVAAAEDIRDAFAGQSFVGAVGHVERFNPALQEMARRMREGELGRVISIATERVGPFPNRIQDVGVVKDLATHDIDIAQWVGGAPFAGISGELAHKMGRPHEDLVVAIGRLENDIVVSINVNWLTPVKRRAVRVLGERGALEADLLTGDLRFFANAEVDSQWDAMAALKGVSEGDMIQYAFVKREPLAVEHEMFRAAITNGSAEGVVSLDEGVSILRVAEQIAEVRV